MKFRVLFLLCIGLSAKAPAGNADSLSTVSLDRVSIEFTGGVIYCNYSFKSVYDYYNDSYTVPDKLKNERGAAFELNVKIPVRKRNIFMNLGIGYTERNLNLIIEDTGILEPQWESESYRNGYLSVLVGLGYKLVEIRDYMLDINLDIHPSFFVNQKLERAYYNNSKPLEMITGYKMQGGIPTKKIIAPLYFKVNNYFKINQHLAYGIGLGVFYDTQLPFYDNITKNSINYNFNVALRYSFL